VQSTTAYLLTLHARIVNTVDKYKYTSTSLIQAIL